ncbi:DUF4259 domain-containing protein [Agrococcus sediminis]|uniref:DUF4259 domain-containing protein n=1 Tax=Agrococcus sediminis TaxID=2599924 RepID=A0A5M8Q3W5_9MICO|nr:DUF4259 domain-containing protein [Agrococcus sediminis]KAA6430575.1 DUF4259 domain-containing protein [Agrococcus sediminis]RWR24300.1 DUF4259 domain-containing protein [Agrococcus lahaulensis]
MGTWGSGPFENDEAADWVYELEDAEDVEALLLETFASTTAAGADAAEASRAVGAAAWLLSGLPGESRPDIEWQGSPPALTEELRTAARAALDAVLADDSEWRELWEEAGDDDAVEEVARLRALVERRG